MHVNINTWNPDGIDANLQIGNVSFNAFGDSTHEHQHVNVHGVPVETFEDLPGAEKWNDDKTNAWKRIDVDSFSITFFVADAAALKEHREAGAVEVRA